MKTTRPGKKGAVDDPVSDDPAKKAYDDLNPANAPSGYRLTDTIRMEGDLKVIRTDVVAPDGSTGWIERAVDPATGKMEMRNAFLDDIPKDMRVLTIDGKTIPLVDYLTMRQMKLGGVGFGGLTKVKMSTIQNVRTVAKLAALEKAGVPPNEAVMKTHSVSYAERSIAGSGQKIKSASVSGGRRTIFDQMLEWYETDGNPGGPRDPAKVKANDKILTQEGVGRNDVVWWDFDIVLELEPSTPGTPTGPTGTPGPTTVVDPHAGDQDREPEPVQ